jgi:hypothetical protein
MAYLSVYFICSAIYIIWAGSLNYKGKNPEHWSGVLVAGGLFWPILLTINLIKIKEARERSSNSSKKIL